MVYNLHKFIFWGGQQMDPNKQGDKYHIAAIPDWCPKKIKEEA